MIFMKVIFVKIKSWQNYLCLIGGLIAGVKAALVRKDNKPKWSPSRIADVTEQSIAHFFQPFANGDELPM